AGHGDVVRRLRFEIRHDAREHVAAMNEPALALPVEKAGRTFADELGQSGRRQRSEMGVRQMREDEHARIIGCQDCDCRWDLRATRGEAAGLSMTKSPSRDNEDHELPIKIPATNTSTPPTTT